MDVTHGNSGNAVNPVHPLNALIPIDVTVSGMVIFVIFAHPLSDSSLMEITFPSPSVWKFIFVIFVYDPTNVSDNFLSTTHYGIVTDRIFAHSLKTFVPTYVTLFGIITFDNEEHF